MTLSKERKTILIVTGQSLPRPDRPTNGASLRAYGLGEALKQCGHQVIYSVPRVCLDGSSDTLEDWLRYSHNVTDIENVVTEVSPDVVIFSNWGLVGEVPECEVPVVVDINGSLVLENYYRGKGTFLDDALTKIRALSKVDLVLAGSVTQKMYLTAWCLMAGMEPDRFSVEVVPFSLPPRMPEPHPPEEPVFVMAGYDWPWLDGQSAVEIVSRELERLQRGHLNVYSSSPPYIDVIPGEDSSRDVAGSLKVDHLPRISLHGPVSFDELTGILSQSSVALDVWSRNLERELAFPTRTVVYLWSGLPVIASPYGELSKLIASYKAGWTVDVSEGRKLADLVHNIVTNPGWLARSRANARRLVTDHLTWDKTIEPLDSFCRSPRKNRHLSRVFSLLDRMEDLRSESEVMGCVHRRPKGFDVLTRKGLAWKKLRRLVIGLPVLVYLLILTSIGNSLFRIWMRWRRS